MFVPNHLRQSLLGNERNHLRSHLRAARELVKIAQGHPSEQQYSEIFAVLFEVYTYYSTMITFQHSASELDIQANIDSLQFYRSLTSYSTFGYIMVAACDLFTLMPEVSLFSLLIRNLGKDDRGLEIDLLYRRLAANILSWQDHDLTQLPEVSVKVTLIYQNALLVFLHASYLGDETDRSMLEATLKPIVADTLSIFESIGQQPASVTTFWPMVILGSCLREQQDKDRLLSYVNQRGLRSGIQGRACEALKWMWERQDEGVFGPVGLERFAKENNTGLCIG